MSEQNMKEKKTATAKFQPDLELECLCFIFAKLSTNASM